jgi:hypothetical protein
MQPPRHRSNPCGPLTDVAEIHKDKTREQSLRLLEECHGQATAAILGAPLRLVDWLVGWLICWLISSTWLVQLGWLVGWLVGWLYAMMVGCMVGWFNSLQLGWLRVRATWLEAPRSRDVETLWSLPVA